MGNYHTTYLNNLISEAYEIEKYLDEYAKKNGIDLRKYTDLEEIAYSLAEGYDKNWLIENSKQIIDDLSKDRIKKDSDRSISKKVKSILKNYLPLSIIPMLLLSPYPVKAEDSKITNLPLLNEHEKFDVIKPVYPDKPIPYVIESHSKYLVVYASNFLEKEKNLVRPFSEGSVLNKKECKENLKVLFKDISFAYTLHSEGLEGVLLDEDLMTEVMLETLYESEGPLSPEDTGKLFAEKYIEKTKQKIPDPQKSAKAYTELAIFFIKNYPQILEEVRNLICEYYDPILEDIKDDAKYFYILEEERIKEGCRNCGDLSEVQRIKEAYFSERLDCKYKPRKRCKYKRIPYEGVKEECIKIHEVSCVLKDSSGKKIFSFNNRYDEEIFINRYGEDLDFVKIPINSNEKRDIIKKKKKARDIYIKIVNQGPTPEEAEAMYREAVITGEIPEEYFSTSELLKELRKVSFDFQQVIIGDNYVIVPKSMEPYIKSISYKELEEYMNKLLYEIENYPGVLSKIKDKEERKIIENVYIKKWKEEIGSKPIVPGSEEYIATCNKILDEILTLDLKPLYKMTSPFYKKSFPGSKVAYMEGVYLLVEKDFIPDSTFEKEAKKVMTKIYKRMVESDICYLDDVADVEINGKRFRVLCYPYKGVTNNFIIVPEMKGEEYKYNFIKSFLKNLNNSFTELPKPKIKYRTLHKGVIWDESTSQSSYYKKSNYKSESYKKSNYKSESSSVNRENTTKSILKNTLKIPGFEIGTGVGGLAIAKLIRRKKSR
jgi:hypothetical protein